MRKKILGITLITLPFLILILGLPDVVSLYPCPLHITECCIVDTSDIYYLDTDLIAIEDCIIITADGSVLVGGNHKIIGSGTGSGINITANNVNVADVEIKNFYRGIIIKGNSNLVTRCKVSNNYFGVIVFDGDGNKVKRNIIVNNYWGLIVTRADYTYVYDNYISNNTENVFDEQSIGDDYFNTSKSPEENIISGSYVGGNYWDDYTGSDNDEDGLGESYYLIPCNSVDPNYCNKDYLPLVDINGPRYSNLTISNSTPTTFTLNITWKDNIQVDKVILELDGTNYTDLQKMNETQTLTPAKIEHSVTFSRTFENLPEGTHYYRWYANDTRNNWNSTELLNFTVGGATTTSTTTSSTSTSTSTSTTTSLPEVCVGVLNLSITPNPVWAGRSVTANVTILNSSVDTENYCEGKKAYVKYGTYKSLKCSCTIVGYSCTCDFLPLTPSTSSTNQTYYAQVDMNGDGDFNDEGEETNTTLTVLCKGEGESCNSTTPCCSRYRCLYGICKKVLYRGGGCPVLKAWNGKEFEEIEKLNIHSEEGKDTVYSTNFKMKPFKENTYKIILEEKWYALLEGSHIDSVKLIDSEGKECNLIKAIHSKLGDVTSLIKESDDERVETRPGESIELIYTGCEGEKFRLRIEGYNPWRSWTKVLLGLSWKNLPLLIICILLAIAIMFGVFKFFKTTIRET